MVMDTNNSKSDIKVRSNAFTGQFSATGMKSYLLARKIEAGMKNRGLTRQSFANLMQVQPSIITRWLSGKHNFTVETLFEIEECLKLKLLAIDAPVRHSMNFQLFVSSDQTVFNDTKEYPGFLPLSEPIPNDENRANIFSLPVIEFNDYLSQLMIDRNGYNK